MSFDQLYWIMLGGCAIGFAATLNRRLAAPIAFVMAGALIAAQAFKFWDLTVDDAYISYRYAYNFAHGSGLVFNPGEHVEGYTNFSWVMLLALTERLGAGIVTPSRWLGFTSDLGTLAVMWLLARRLAPESRRTADAVFAGAALVFGALPSTGYWATAGLEEPLFTFLVALALYRAMVESEESGRLPLSAAIALLAALTRPEGLIVVIVLLIAKGADAARWRDNRRFQALAVWCAIVFLPYAAYIGWRWSYYGYPLPNTYYQKVGGGPLLDWGRYRDGLGYVRSFWIETGALLIFPLPLVALARADRRARALPLIGFGALWTAYVAYVGGDFMSFHRFMLPVIPIALVLAVDSFVFVVGQFSREQPARWLAPAGAVVGVLAVAWLIVVPRREVELLAFRRSKADAYVEIGAWLKQQDPGTHVAVGASGYIPFVTRTRTLDTLGLTDEHIAHGPRLSDTINTPGHRKGDGAYVIAQAPDIIIIDPKLDLLPAGGIEWVHRLDAGELLAADSALLSQPDFWQVYDAVWVQLPSGKYFNFFRLTGSTKVEGTLAEFQ